MNVDLESLEACAGASASFVPLSPATNTVREGGTDPTTLRVTVLGGGR